MKILNTLMLATPLMVSAGIPIVKNANIKNVYVPYGYDNNDNVEFVVTGWHPNECVKEPIVEVNVEDFIVDVDIKTLSYSESNPFCPREQTSFKKIVDLGELEKGIYEVRVNDGTRYESFDDLEVLSSSSDDVDKHNYPDVRKIEVTRDKVVLDTYILSDCYELKEVKVQDDGEDTYSVLPIMTKVRSFCPQKIQPYSITFDKPERLGSDRALLHVRSDYGESVNKLIKQ